MEDIYDVRDLFFLYIEIGVGLIMEKFDLFLIMIVIVFIYGVFIIC